jgi:hypothetical protein
MKLTSAYSAYGLGRVDQRTVISMFKSFFFLSANVAVSLGFCYSAFVNIFSNIIMLTVKGQSPHLMRPKK